MKTPIVTQLQITKVNPMYYKVAIAFVFLGLFAPSLCLGVETFLHEFGTASEHVLGFKRWASNSAQTTVEQFDCGIRIWSGYGAGSFEQADFYLAWVKGLEAGDSVLLEGKGCDTPYSAMYSHFWTYDCDEIVQDQQCQLSQPVQGTQIHTSSFTVPQGACGLVICGINRSGTYDVLDWIRLTVPDHSEIVLPGGIVGDSTYSWGAVKALYR